MPCRCAIGRTSTSMPRTSSEYGGCSVRKRWRFRSRATHCASTISPPENDDEPMYRILPCCTRSVSAPSVSSMSVPGTGRCSWYRSIQSVPSRRSECSTSSMIQRRDAPPRFGPSPIGAQNFVASTTLSRRPPASALPTISSDSPAE